MASHDLRTPIAALQAELELAEDARTTDPELRSAVRAAHADAVRLGELATGLLDLATRLLSRVQHLRARHHNLGQRAPSAVGNGRLLSRPSFIGCRRMRRRAVQLCLVRAGPALVEATRRIVGRTIGRPG
ncbi:MAG: hypothetical protein MUQ32_16785, partial [Chloroflexi bacterium]|nr:hypothetical protein [Chloroflexota bacterium]